MSRILGMLLAIVAFFFYLFLGSDASAAEPTKPSFDDVATALVRSAKITSIIENGPAAIEGHARVSELHHTLAKTAMSPLGVQIPEAPNFYFSGWGIDEHNNMLAGVDMEAGFVPATPVRFYTDGVQLRRNVFPQIQPVSQDPESPFDLTRAAVAEIHNIAVKVPGKLGTHRVDVQIDWTSEYYFGVTFEQEVRPLGSLLHVCLSGNAVKLYHAFNVFDGKFPSSPNVSVNGRGLSSTEPPVVEHQGFFDFLTMKVSEKTYSELLADGENGWLFVLNAGPGETEVSFYDWLPPLEETVSCVESSTTASSKRRAAR